MNEWNLWEMWKTYCRSIAEGGGCSPQACELQGAPTATLEGDFLMLVRQKVSGEHDCCDPCQPLALVARVGVVPSMVGVVPSIVEGGTKHGGGST